MNIDDAKRVIAKQLKINEEDITPDSKLVDDLKADSLDIVELVMELEEKYGLEIPDEDMPNLQTVQNVVDYIEKKSK